MKIALLHRYPEDRIKETNAAFPYLKAKGIDVLTFKKFDRISKFKKFWKSILWIVYAPFLVCGKRYDVVYCDDSYPFYPALVKLVAPWSKVVIRLGDLHLMYYYSGLTYKILHYFEKVGWNAADEIICISNPMTEYVWNETRGTVATVYDPVDLSHFKSVCGSYCRHETVMFHGTLTKNKNVDILLDAARLLPEIEFEIVGGGPDLKRLKSIAPSNVYFHGWVPFKEIPRLISTCAIGVALRSDNPGNEYVVTSPYLQYGAMGKPCLVTQRKVYGEYKWEFTSASGLASGIEQLLKSPWKEGQKLRNYIVENHDSEKIGEQIWKILTLQS